MAYIYSLIVQKDESYMSDIQHLILNHKDKSVFYNIMRVLFLHMHV